MVGSCQGNCPDCHRATIESMTVTEAVEYEGYGTRRTVYNDEILDDNDYINIFLGGFCGYHWSWFWGCWWFCLMYWPVKAGPLLRGVIGRGRAAFNRRIALRHNRWGWCYGI